MMIAENALRKKKFLFTFNFPEGVYTRLWEQMTISVGISTETLSHLFHPPLKFSTSSENEVQNQEIEKHYNAV